MEHKLCEFETKADVPEVDGRGGQGLPRALAKYNIEIPPSPDLNRRSLSCTLVSIGKLYCAFP